MELATLSRNAKKRLETQPGPAPMVMVFAVSVS